MFAGFGEKNKLRRVVRNVMENGYTERRVIYLTLLTEPQGKFKKRFFYFGTMKPKHVVRNEVEDGSTERRVKYLTLLAEPQGKFKKPLRLGC